MHTMLVGQRPNRQPINPMIAANHRELLHPEPHPPPHLRDQQSGLSGHVSPSGGASSNRHNHRGVSPRWGQIRPSHQHPAATPAEPLQGVHPGPSQAVTGRCPMRDRPVQPCLCLLCPWNQHRSNRAADFARPRTNSNLALVAITSAAARSISNQAFLRPGFRSLLMGW